MRRAQQAAPDRPAPPALEPPRIGNFRPSQSSTDSSGASRGATQSGADKQSSSVARSMLSAQLQAASQPRGTAQAAQAPAEHRDAANARGASVSDSSLSKPARRSQGGRKKRQHQARGGDAAQLEHATAAAEPMASAHLSDFDIFAMSGSFADESVPDSALQPDSSQQRSAAGE